MNMRYLFSSSSIRIAIAAVVIIGIAGYGIVRTQTSKPTGTLTVTRGDIAQTVIVTGKIQPVENVDLAFEIPGTIAKAYVAVGDTVSPGTVLAELNQNDLRADLLQAQADAASAEATLDQLKRGTRPEELRIQQGKVDNAKTAIEDARRNLANTIQDAYTKSDDAIHNAVDQLFNNPRSSDPRIIITGFYEKTSLENQRFPLEGVLGKWQTSVSTMGIPDDFSSYISLAQANLSLVKTFLEQIAIGVNGLTPTSSLSKTTIDGYKSDISTARTNINTAISNLSTAIEKVNTAKATLANEQNTLLLDQAGSTPEDIATQEAAVESAKAKVLYAEARLGKTVMRSPIRGIVTKQDAKQGQIASANTALVSVISTNRLDIEAEVPEVDVGNIVINDPVSITLDALPGETFRGRVSYIDPAETIIDGVVNYKVTILFDMLDQRFKSGLTANLSIETEKKQGVLILPQYAIIENDSGTFVRKVSRNGTETDVPVTLGITSIDGNVEILSGVSEGDTVANIGIKK